MPGIIVAEGFELVLFCIAAAAVAEVHFTEVLEEMAFVLGEFCSYGVGEQQDGVAFVLIDIPEVAFVPWPAEMIAGVVVHEADVALVQLFADIGIVSMEVIEIIVKIKSVVEAEIDRGVDLRFREAVGSSFYFIDDGLLGPEEVIQRTPPAGGAPGYESVSRGSFYVWGEAGGLGESETVCEAKTGAGERGQLDKFSPIGFGRHLYAVLSNLACSIALVLH
jgi:hypothetical protein